MRRSKSWSLAVLAASALWISGPAAAAERPSLVVAESGGAFFNILEYIARDKGFFREQGVDPDIVVVQSGARQVAALMGGSVDVAPMGFQLVVQAASKGGDLVAVATTYDIFPIAVTLSNAAIQRTGITVGMSTDEKVRRLHGLKLAITSPGSGTDSMLRTLFTARGLVPDQEVVIQPLGVPENMIAAMQQRVVDGFLFSSPMPELAVERKLGQIVIEPLNGDVPEVNGMPYVILGTTRALLESRHAQVTAAVRAYTQAIKFVHEHPDEARQITHRYFPDVEDGVFNLAFAKYLRGIPTSPVVTPDQLAKIVDWLNLSEPTPISVRYADVVAPDIAIQANKDILAK
jgi:NitT/TauT family transport system substrate-binding protein